jgi:hypothetical protein
VAGRAVVPYPGTSRRVPPQQPALRSRATTAGGFSLASFVQCRQRDAGSHDPVTCLAATDVIPGGGQAGTARQGITQWNGCAILDSSCGCFCAT